MSEKRVAVTGGTGFVGRWLIDALTKRGYRVRVATRHPERVRHLQLFPNTTLVPMADFEPLSLERLVAGCDAAINLAGILNEAGRDGSGFRRVHVELPLNLAAACRNQGVTRLLHMSALNADAENGPSHYLRSKGEGEDKLHGMGDLQVTSFRPSVIFGPGDSFFNRFAALLKLTPLFFPLACPNARFAPVYVADVAQAFVNSIDNERTFGRRYDLCGPAIYTLRELVEYTAQQIGLRRRIVPLNDTLSHLQAAVLEWVPGKPMSLDNYRSLQVDSVCKGAVAPELGISPTAIDAVVPRYLGTLNRTTRLAAWRSLAGRG
ncbi:MAG: complex I NDUFA9 subunit family protein [Gammaproteobacteria bacterium]